MYSFYKYLHFIVNTHYYKYPPTYNEMKKIVHSNLHSQKKLLFIKWYNFFKLNTKLLRAYLHKYHIKINNSIFDGALRSIVGGLSTLLNLCLWAVAARYRII